MRIGRHTIYTCVDRDGDPRWLTHADRSIRIGLSKRRAGRYKTTNILERQKYWEGPTGFGTSRPQIEPLEAVRFLLHHIYADRTIKTDSSIGGRNTVSAEELVGCLLVIRDALLSHDHDERCTTGNPNDLELPMKIRLNELLAAGYSHEDAKSVIRMEWPMWLRSDIYERQQRLRAKYKRWDKEFGTNYSEQYPEGGV